MEIKPLRRCELCSYFEMDYPGASHGQCRYDPPKEERIWPEVEGKDWCGKFKKF